MRIRVLLLLSILLLSCTSHEKSNVKLDGTDLILTTEGGAKQCFKADFVILKAEKNPNKKLRRGDFGYVKKEWETQGLLYNVPTWGQPEEFVMNPNLHVEDGYNPETDRAYGKNRTANLFMAASSELVSATSARYEDGKIIWEFEDHPEWTLSAEVVAGSAHNGLPCISIKFIPKQNAWYSVGYVGAPQCDEADVEELWQAHIWNEKRFPNQPFLSESFRTPIPTTLLTVKGITTGVIGDPSYVPYEATPPVSANSKFAVALRNASGNAQTMIFAPVFGNDDSQMEKGSTFTFDFWLYQKKSSLMEAFKDIATEFCEFRDLRRNSTCNLNTTIENTLDYCLGPHAMFIDSLKGCNYSTDVPGAVKNISGLHSLEFAILTDREDIFTRMSRPMLEYGLSRERFLFSPYDNVKGQNTSSRIDGPGVPVTDLITTYIYANERSDWFLEIGKKLYEDKAERILNMDYMSYEDRWLNSLELYHATGDKAYLKQAVVDCDQYLEERVKVKQTDFYDKYSLGIFFWTSFTNQWMELLWMYELTGYKRYLDAAYDGALHYAQYTWFLPVIPDGNVRVNPGGVVPKYRVDESKYIYMNMPEEDVEAWKLSEIGLTPESSGTSAGHRGIFMAHHAPFMMRIAALTGDKFLHDIARHAVVGRYESFPCYHINAGRTNAFEKKDFPLRSQAELNGHTSIHYNHPQSHLAMLYDYLFSDFYYVSKGKIDFPMEYSEGYAYCRSFIYGASAGKFYGEENVWPYMPKGMVNSSSIQVNWIAGYGNGKLYLAFANQSDGDVMTNIHLDEATSFVDPAKTYNARLYVENKPFGSMKIKNGSMELVVKAKGITAVIIDGVDVKTKFQHKLRSDSPKWKTNYTTVNFYDDRAVVFDFGTGLKSVYVWNESNNKNYVQTTLHYSVDGVEGEIVKNGYPYEYTVPLTDENSVFEYWFESLKADGTVELSEKGRLEK